MSETHAPQREPNVTPMIDVLLVLLIVFMTVVSQTHHSIDAQLDQPCVGPCPSSDPIVLEVLPGPSYAINRRPVAAAALVAELASIYRSRPDKVVQVAGHRGVSYQAVVSAIDAAKSAGVRVVGLETAVRDRAQP